MRSQAFDIAHMRLQYKMSNARISSANRDRNLRIGHLEAPRQGALTFPSRRVLDNEQIEISFLLPFDLVGQNYGSNGQRPCRQTDRDPLNDSFLRKRQRIPGLTGRSLQ